ncbi:PE-PPE domain-containing protein [Candidatus Mycobacterium wuenschmannii]|uniref:PE-PPE domain-containing protein n=1 Tax=Candidatus Mycobacterium wuenschmannii TaxID=3027808 RepID=A0ABY8W255_9MYCO|nr:PE-PPE domain-containing protein [Candidatus Mycobacterium wuenschmannii]WIM88508.1 PE-PPE domain-containing protein [Candidatus Mycobacterium wuenschmannii]
MKKMFFAAALCGAALAFAGPANADSDSDFWAAGASAIQDWLLGGVSHGVDPWTGPPLSDVLDDSTHALILGSTGIATPGAGYISNAFNLYLEPNGYDGDLSSVLPLTTPNTFSFLQSVQQGQQDLINGILADFKAGEMDCNALGVCSDPMTIFTYSQSSAVAALAEQQLFADKIPTDALHFVMLGANPDGVPDSFFPTDIYNIDGDLWAEPLSIDWSDWNAVVVGAMTHLVYLGLSSDQIASATTVVDGLTTIHEIPALTVPELWDALINVWAGGALVG